MLFDRSLCLEAVASLGQLSGPLFHRFTQSYGVTVHDPDELWELRDELPPSFVDDVHRAADVARDLERDHHAVSVEAPMNEAVALLLDDPHGFRRIHRRCAAHGEREFQLFVGRRAAMPILDRARVADAEARLRDAFGGRTSPEIRLWLAPKGLQFSVRFHARRRDVVMFLPRTDRLAVSAPDHRSTEVYVAAFGELLADDREWFARSSAVTLDPLVWAGRAALRPTREVTEVRLVEVGFRGRDDRGEVLIVHADDAMPAVERRPGELLHARLELRVGSTWRPVELAGPDRIAYDWRHDAEAVRAFLEERGFLAGPRREPQCRAA